MKQIPQLKITIRNQTDEESIIDIDGEIGWDITKRDIKDQIKNISGLKSKKITVNISSLGGFVDDGLAIHDILASHPAEITTNVTGMTASAATIIAQAGNNRRISDNALYLVHKSWGMGIGNADDFESLVKDLKTIDERIANIYAKRSGTNIKDIKALMKENGGAGIWLSGEEAKRYGLVDEVYEPMQAAAAVSNEILNQIGLPIPGINNNNMDDKEKNLIQKLIDSIENAFKSKEKPEDKAEEPKNEPEIDEKQVEIERLKAEIEAKNAEMQAKEAEVNEKFAEQDEAIKKILAEKEELKNTVFGSEPPQQTQQVEFNEPEDGLVKWYKTLNRN